jgi:diguanylate cyclase
MMRWPLVPVVPGGAVERPLRLLVVDDSEDDVLLLEAELTRRGLVVQWCRVDTAIDMAAALSAEHWDLVLADHAMPGFDAHGALDVLVRSGKDLPFIVHSGQMPAAQGVSAMYDGAHDFVIKGDYARLIPVIEREFRALQDRGAVREADRRIRELSHFDGLSMLPNLSLFCARLSDWQALCRSNGRAARGAVLIVDVDRFMRINTSLGYETGSGILLEMSQRLVEAVPPTAVLARLGGDRFGAFLPGVGDDGQAELAARWLTKALERPFLREQGELVLTASVGIAMVDGHSLTAVDILTQAEAALAEAKRAGGNALRLYERSLSQASVARLQLEIDLRRTLGGEQLCLYYQPIVDAMSCHACGAEALLRWAHPVHGLLAPDRFIELADETGLIFELGEWVLREACMQGRKWHDAGQAGFQMSVNISAVQLARPGLLTQVERALEQSGFPPHSLVLEITESSLMSDVDSAGRLLRALKVLGVQIAIDDFGTGYSSLAYLRRLPIDAIKIDRSFIRDLNTDDDSTAIVHATLAMAESLRLRVVAEGVETAAQEILLQSERCDKLQGFRYGRPVAAAKFRFGSLNPDH